MLWARSCRDCYRELLWAKVVSDLRPISPVQMRVPAGPGESADLWLLMAYLVGFGFCNWAVGILHFPVDLSASKDETWKPTTWLHLADPCGTYLPLLFQFWLPDLELLGDAAIVTATSKVLSTRLWELEALEQQLRVKSSDHHYIHDGSWWYIVI